MLASPQPWAGMGMSPWACGLPPPSHPCPGSASLSSVPSLSISGCPFLPYLPETPQQPLEVATIAPPSANVSSELSQDISGCPLGHLVDSWRTLPEGISPGLQPGEASHVLTSHAQPLAVSSKCLAYSAGVQWGLSQVIRYPRPVSPCSFLPPLPLVC